MMVPLYRPKQETNSIYEQEALYFFPLYIKIMLTACSTGTITNSSAVHSWGCHVLTIDVPSWCESFTP